MVTELPLVQSPRLVSDSRGSSNSMHSHPESSQQSGNDEFWDNVEDLLTKPAPSLKKISKKKRECSLPNLKPSASHIGKTKRQPSRPKQKTNNQEHSRFDNALLQEAFAYVKKIQDDDDCDMRTKKNTRNRDSCVNIDQAGQAYKGCQKGQIKKKKKKKTKSISKLMVKYSSSRPNLNQNKSKNNWNSSISKEEISSNQNGGSRILDQSTIEQMVKDFQTQSTINSLKKELAASKESLESSRNIIQSAAQTFFH